MIAARRPIQRRLDARLLVIDERGAMTEAARSRLADFLQRGDLVVANDAATLPASLRGVHLASGAAIEARLAGRASLAPRDLEFAAVVFGAGDWRTRTEDRPLPPPFALGDRVALGPLNARIEGWLGHRRLVALAFEGDPDSVWAGIARHGRPVQYAYVDGPLALWDVWAPIAALPVAFEPPSAGFALDWSVLQTLRARGAEFATITLAAGISSTGDAALDARLPFDEPYRIPPTTVAAIARTRARGGRIIAVGTTVVRALEHSAGRAGDGVADQRLGAGTRLCVCDAILSGTHTPQESHYQVLRAFQDDGVLARAATTLENSGYLTHEFGDSVLVFARPRGADAGDFPRRRAFGPAYSRSMAHVFEPAASGRSRCRGCGRALARGEIRFGERLPNPYGEGEMTLWFHPLCAAYKRPEPMLEALAQAHGDQPDRAALERAAQASVANARLPRIDGAERAKGQANCRQCHEPIPRGDWRIRLVSYDEGQFSPLGFIHVSCAHLYFETTAIVEPLMHFSAALSDPEREALRATIERAMRSS